MIEANITTQILNPVLPAEIYDTAVEVSMQFGYFMLFAGIVIGMLITYGIMKNWPLIKEKING
jgi:uncharacterized membrane protein YdbT with pleckstrin-like domain